MIDKVLTRLRQKFFKDRRRTMAYSSYSRVTFAIHMVINSVHKCAVSVQ